MVGLLVAWVTPGLAQESPLAQLPADSSIVIQIHGIERTRDRFVALVKSALPDLAPMVQDRLSREYPGFEGRKFNGLNKDGPHFVIFTELPAPGVDRPKLALVLHAANYQDLVKGFLK